MTDFLRGPNNTFRLNHRYPSFGRPWTRVYADTLIDSWFVGDFSSANYLITVEFDSNQKETMQVLVIARPEHASFTIYGRTSIQDELITLSATVTASKLYLTASSASSAFDGAKVIFTATYAETISQLGKPTVVPGTSSGGSALDPIDNAHSFGTIAVLSQENVTAAAASDEITFLTGNGINITTNNTSKSITFSSVVDLFKTVTVGSTVITASDPNDSIRFSASNGVAITASTLTNTISLSATGILSSLDVSGDSTLNTLTVSENTILSNLTVNGNLIINGSTTSVNSTALTIADYNITLAQGATTSQLANGSGITIAGALASLNWDHSTSSWQSNKIITPSVNNALTLGTSGMLWQNVYATTLTGTLAAGAQPNITALGSLSTLTVNGLASFNGTSTFTGSVSAATVSVSGILDVTSTRETVVDVTSASTVNYDYAASSIFYHSTSPAVDWIANFANLPNTVNGKSITLNIIVPQGSTAYKISSVTIAGVSQTILWSGSSLPAGTASKTDIWAFTFIRRSNAWTLFGSRSANFG